MGDDGVMEQGRALRFGSLGPAGEERFKELSAIDPGYARSILEYCFGTIWSRPGLDLKVREFIVIAAAAAQDLPGEVEMHVRGALNRGATREEIIETVVQCAPYIGLPKTNHALQAANRVIEGWDAHPEWHSS